MFNHAFYETKGRTFARDVSGAVIKHLTSSAYPMSAHTHTHTHTHTNTHTVGFGNTPLITGGFLGVTRGHWQLAVRRGGGDGGGGAGR